MILVDLDEFDWQKFFPNMLEASDESSVGIIERFSVKWKLSSYKVYGSRFWSLVCQDNGLLFSSMTMNELLDNLRELGLTRFHFKFSTVD